MEKGFSLVELSVVIIIIGLLTAAITGGLALQKSARTQALITDLARNKDAAVMFKEKYYYWPGDMTDSLNYWAGVANGNGDGMISYSILYDRVLGEVYAATQALSASGFITGTYSGTSGATSFQKAPVDAVSGMTLNNPVYVFHNVQNDVAMMSSRPVWGKNAVSVMDLSPVSGQPTHSRIGGALRPDVALAIDQKIDDRHANTGFLRGFGGNATCVDGSFQYDVANNSARRCLISLALE